MRAARIGSSAIVCLSLTLSITAAQASNLSVVEVGNPAESGSRQFEPDPGLNRSRKVKETDRPALPDFGCGSGAEPQPLSGSQAPCGLPLVVSTKAAAESESSAKNTSRRRESLLKDRSLLIPALVPYQDELLLQGSPVFEAGTLESLAKKAVLLRKDCHDQSLGIYRGRILAHCQSPLRVRTPDALVKVAAGAVVYIYTSGESQVILNLHDRHRRDVMVSVGKDEFELPPGREILITRYPSLSFDEARLLPGIWYRSVYLLKNQDGVKVYETQFSTISAAVILPAVKRLMASDRKIYEKLAKTFAAVITVSHDRQAFRPAGRLAEKKGLLAVSGMTKQQAGPVKNQTLITKH